MLLALLQIAPHGLTMMSTLKVQPSTSKQPSRVRMQADSEATRDGEPGAMDAVTAWQPASLAKVVDTLGLTENEYASELGYDSFSLAGTTGSVQSYEGQGAPNVAWCSGLQLPGARASVAAFCGPLTDVPHLIASAGVSDGGIDLYIDWRPRADAAYDPACQTLADYPEPSDRNMFAQGSARKDFASCFFTEDAAAWRDALLAQGTPNAPLSVDQTAAVSAGPLLIDIRLPLTDGAAAAASGACEAAVDRWLSWMTGAADMGRELPAGAKQTSTYARDTKVRQNHFGYLLSKYTALYGAEEGKALTTADAGPLDEAYVGGGS
jgi:hypothetical protein